MKIYEIYAGSDYVVDDVINDGIPDFDRCSPDTRASNEFTPINQNGNLWLWVSNMMETALSLIH
jgi:hypothetical protein